MQGASPLASPGAEPGRHRNRGGVSRAGGGLAPALPANPAVSIPNGGVRRLGLPPCPAFSLLCCPLSPQPPSPAGKGEILGYFMQGASPLASPRLDGARHWLSLPYRCLGGGGITRRERFLSVLRRPIGSAAGVPGAKPPAKSTKNLPLPAGKGGRGMGAEKQAKGKVGRRQRKQDPRRVPQRQGQPVPQAV